MEGKFWDALFVVSYLCLIFSFLLAFLNISEYWYLVIILYLSTPVCILLVAVEFWSVKKKGSKS